MLPQEALDIWNADKPLFVRDYVEKVSALPAEQQAAVYWVAGLIKHFAEKPQKLDAALWNYEQGFAAAHEVGDYASAAQNLAAIGCVHRVYGTKAASPEGTALDYAQARITLNKAMELAREAGYTKGWMDAAGQLSLMMSPAEKYAFNGERLPVARELMPDSGALVDLIHTQAVAAVELADLSQNSLKILDTLLETHKDFPNQEDLCAPLREASASFKTQITLFYEEAETLFKESFALTETLPETEDPEYKRICNYIRYGEFLEKQNNPEAWNYLQNAVEMAHGYRDGTGNADAITQAERSRDAYLERHPEIATTLLPSTQNT